MKLQQTKNGNLWECLHNGHRNVSNNFKQLFNIAWRRQSERLEINNNQELSK